MEQPNPRRGALWGLAFVFVCAMTGYWMTVCPAITWWDSGQYSLAAVTLGITPPPGSLLLTILGWLATRLPFDTSPELLLNLLAAKFAAITVCIVYLIAIRLVGNRGETRRHSERQSLGAAVVGAAFGALAFGFSRTLWEYATQFSPYILTTVFTGLIFWSMLRWWETAERLYGWRWLLVLGILFGLDFSVHRTNLLLLPCLLIWILIRHPRTLISPRAWIAGAIGMAAGLSFHLLIMPIAASKPFLNAGDPSNWTRFYDYVSLRQFGGGWLVKFYPRNGPFWDTQVMDLLRAFGSSFLWLGGKLRVIGLLPALLAATGVFTLWRRNHRLAIAVVALLIVHTAMTISYFNIPENFFRSLHRHYLPVMTIFAVLIAYGLGVIFRGAWNALGTRHWHVAALVGLLLALIPASQLLRNWNAVDASKNYFTEDYASNTLAGLPGNAILFTNGDNDTWPMWFMQAAHGLRPDVQVINLPLTNTTWSVDQLADRDPDFPLSLTADERHALRFRPWPDTTVALPVSGTPAQYGLPDSLTLPDTVLVHAAPTINGQYVMTQDQLLLNIAQANRWRRPLCFATTVSPPSRQWLAPYSRLDGLFWRVVPYGNPPANTAILRENLLDKASYRGYADANVRLDDVTRMMASNYYQGLMELAHAQFAQGDSSACVRTRGAIETLLPPERLQPGEQLQMGLESVCNPAPADSSALSP